jgi:Fe-S-cluster containining protein
MIDGKVFFYHPCSELTENGKCRIYDHRPRFCGPGMETNYRALEQLGCAFYDQEQDDPGVIKIHMTEACGSAERMH